MNTVEDPSELNEQPPAPSKPAYEEVSFWFKALLKIAGTVGSVLCMVLGIYMCITSLFTPKCLAAGILMVIFGFVVLMFEAPICCQFFDLLNKISNWANEKPPWIKALIYCLTSIGLFATCPSITSFFGLVGVFITGVLYGLMMLGKKGDGIKMARTMQYQKQQDELQGEAMNNLNSDLSLSSPPKYSDIP